MTSFERFENRMPMLLEDLAVPRLPDYSDDLFARTAATRQRPGWSFPERWLPMSTITTRLTAVPRVPWRLGVLAALLAAVALVAAIVAGSILNRRPAPYGPAANGQIALVDRTGNIVLSDPVSGLTKSITTGGHSGSPVFSQDGSRIAFIRSVPGESRDLVVMNVDGSGERTLNSLMAPVPSYFGWSPNGDRLLLVTQLGRMLVFDTSKTGEPMDLSQRLGMTSSWVGLSFNYRSLNAFRPGTNEIAFVDKNASPPLLRAAGLDGTGLRTLFGGVTGLPTYSDIRGAQWSPDGAKVLFQLDQSDGGRELWHTFVANADGTNLEPLTSYDTSHLADMNSPMWSPDGTQVAFQYWTWHTADDGADFHPIAIADAATGKVHEVGKTFANGYVSWEWSPDGASILEIPGDESGESDCSGPVCVPLSGGSILIVDATTGAVTTAPWSADQPISWRRIAR